MPSTLFPAKPVRLGNRTINVNFRKNNRLRPRPGRFGFLTEPHFEQKLWILQTSLESRRVYLLGVFDRGLCLGISAYFCVFLQYLCRKTLPHKSKPRRGFLLGCFCSIYEAPSKMSWKIAKLTPMVRFCGVLACPLIREDEGGVSCDLHSQPHHITRQSNGTSYSTRGPPSHSRHSGSFS